LELFWYWKRSRCGGLVKHRPCAGASLSQNRATTHSTEQRHTAQSNDTHHRAITHNTVRSGRKSTHVPLPRSVGVTFSANFRLLMINSKEKEIFCSICFSTAFFLLHCSSSVHPTYFHCHTRHTFCTQCFLCAQAAQFHKSRKNLFENRKG